MRSTVTGWILAGAAVAGAFALGARRWTERHGATEIRVHNVDRRALHAVLVQITGGAYLLGELPADATRSIYLEPTGESGIGFSFVDDAGQVRRLAAEGYFEAGYGGSISVDITSARVTRYDEAFATY